MRWLLAFSLVLASCGKPARHVEVSPRPDPTIPDPPIPSREKGIVTKHGWLSVDGNRVVDKDGKPFQMKGFSLFWSQWSGDFYIPETVQVHKKLGASVVRAAMGVEMGGYLTNPKEQDKIETIVRAAIEEDIYVIIDWHAHGNYQKEAKAFFIKMAQKYGNTPHVIFELWNEPVFQSWEEVKAYSQDVVDAIRAVGARNLVIVGSPSWSQRVDQAAADPVFDHNVAYTIHFYAATHGQWLRDRVAQALRDGIAIVATEWGTCDASGNGRIDLEESERWLTFLAANDIGWANWSWFDKNESASALEPGTAPKGPYQYTTSGEWVIKQL